MGLDSHVSVTSVTKPFLGIAVGTAARRQRTGVGSDDGDRRRRRLGGDGDVAAPEMTTRHGEGVANESDDAGITAMAVIMNRFRVTTTLLQLQLRTERHARGEQEHTR